ncbi:MAG: phage head closure protein [Pseudomonadota bacterium]
MRAVRNDPGALSKRMELQRPLETSDGSGGLLVTWETVATVWCELKPVRHLAQEFAQQSIEDTWHDIKLRHRADVASGQRLVMANRIFKIETVWDPDERAGYLICRTREQGL